MEGQPMLGGAGNPVGKKFQNASWKILFFSAGLATVFGAVLGLWSMIGTLASPFDIIIFSYLLLFGLIMAALDVPYFHPKLMEFRLVIFKACLFLTRFIGRGVMYVFLGCMVCGNLWDNDTVPFVGFIIFGYLSVVGVGAIYYGIKLTRKLDIVRKALLNRGGPTPSICPPQGLRMDKFGELALKIQGIQFTQEELHYVCNALSQSFHADEVISQTEFEFWLKNPTPVLI
mmetsp:Transcript_17253/g.42806  ORF Transcript_17253/g.42806 Transcript_17253/m.42806 type:complete len:230 (+) Transcript_17253:57-746(+)